MVNIGTRIAPVNVASSRSRIAALIENKVLQYTTLSKKLNHFTLSEIKTLFFTLSEVLAGVSIYRVDQKQHSNSKFLTKSLDNTLQTCLDIAKQYRQTYNTFAGVKSYVSCSLHQRKCAGYTMLSFVCICSL